MHHALLYFILYQSPNNRYSNCANIVIINYYYDNFINKCHDYLPTMLSEFPLNDMPMIKIFSQHNITQLSKRCQGCICCAVFTIFYISYFYFYNSNAFNNSLLLAITYLL